jgi:hypothetical protein
MPVAQGGVLAESDEYRCFALDSNLDRDAFITAYEVLPGTPALVHHVVAFLVDPDKVTRKGQSNAAVMAALDAEDGDRIGWPCFGMAGKDVEVESVPIIWAPGLGPVTYPGGMGVLHRARHKLVIQMHYNLADARVRGMSDSTTVRFKHAPTVERQALFLVEDGLLGTLDKDQPDMLPPGRKSVSYTWGETLAQAGLEGVPYVDLVGVMPHMHQRGVRKQMTIQSGGETKACAAKVDRWDFHWQKFYFYKGGALPRLTPESRLEVTCEYDTSLDQMPVMPGWGTRNEMCTAILMFALPPGV